MPFEKTEKIWMDGELVPWDEARVHVLTHSLHYGSGVFEGIRTYAAADGPFTIGSPAKEAGRNDDEGPQREITIAPFWLGKCEVT